MRRRPRAGCYDPVSAPLVTTSGLPECVCVAATGCLIALIALSGDLNADQEAQQPPARLRRTARPPRRASARRPTRTRDPQDLMARGR